MTQPFIVGITGFAQSGKDTAAHILIDKMGFKRFAFADPLKRDLVVLDPIVCPDSGVRLSEVLETLDNDLDRVKQVFPEWRRLCQIYGTEVQRSVDPHIWIRRTVNAIQHDFNTGDGAGRYVIPDVRFVNEREGVIFDVMIRIVRPGLALRYNHASENEIPFINVESEILNDGTPEDLHRRVYEVVSTSPRWFLH